MQVKKGIDIIKRWIVHKNNKELKLYYNTFEEAQQNNPNCQISEYHDDSHIQYINKINSLSIETLYDYRNRPLLKIPHNAGHILVRVCLDSSDGVYYDYLEYQRHDEYEYMLPIGFVSSTPERFVKLFLSDLDKDIKPYRLSNKEIKKIKAKRFYNKNNKAYWVDSDGYLYFANKIDLPSKKDQIEWDTFHDNEDAVLVVYTEPLKYATKVEWFLNLESFKSRFKEVLDETPSSYATPTYTIKKRGYKKLHPQNRENIFRLPFFNIETECSLSDTLNTKQIYTQMARKWAKMLDGYKFFGEWFENVEMLEDIIEKYLDYLKETKQGGSE